MPGGMYDVKIVAGGGSPTKQRFSVEGVPLTQSATQTNTATEWLEETVTVVVTDGRLTITAGPGSSMCFVQIIAK